MGCGGSSFPEDENKFLRAAALPKEKKYMDDSLRDDQNVIKLCLKKRLMEKPMNFTVKKEDGSDFCKIENGKSQMRLTNMNGDLIGMMIHDVRMTEVNGIDATFNLPHMYIYHTRPYVDGVTDSDYVDQDDKQVFIWARIHKTSMGSKYPSSFEICLAEGKKSGDNLNIEMFTGSPIELKSFSESNMALKRHGNGAARITDADFSFECANCYNIAIAPCMDPVLVLCSIMGVDTLKDG